MKNVIFFSIFTFFSASLFAANITNSSTGYDWIRASKTERFEYSKRIVSGMNARYSARTLMDCLDEAYSGRETLAYKVPEVATLCHAMLK